MINLFDTPRMASGYARSRPPVHPHIIARIRDRLQIAAPVRRALDVGCGAGLSTHPLGLIAAHTIGFDPSTAMLAQASTVAPGADCAAGLAEALPVRSHSVDLVTAAGSLNWGADLGEFFDEACRVLVPDGKLVIYDYGEGRELRGSDSLTRWFREFSRRYPSPPALTITPESLRPEPHGFRSGGHERFEIGLTLTPEFYIGYMMTETNVAEALGRGVPEQEIRDWCEETLPAVFHGRAQEVLFKGYIAYFTRT